MRELLKKFSQKEQDEILSFPQFFQLNSNEFLKELVEEKHKNLYEIICNEEDKEIELKNLKQKQKEDLNNYKNNYNKTYHSRRSRKILLKNMDSEDISSNINSNINNSNDSFKTKKSKKIVMNFKKSFFSRNISEFPSGNKIVFKTDNNINSLKNKKNVFFQGNIWNKSKLSNKEMEKRIKEKYEKLKKRKEWIILNKEKKKEEIKSKENKKEENKSKENKKEETQNENKIENKIEEVEIKDKKTLLEQTKEDISNTSNMIGGWFSYLGNAIKNSADYMGITPKIQEAKTTFDNSMEKYGFNEMIQKTKDSIVNASISTANYIKETGKNIIENETLKNAFGNVNKKYNEFVGKAEDYITKDNVNQEKIREKINKDNNNPSDVVSQLKSDL